MRWKLAAGLVYATFGAVGVGFIAAPVSAAMEAWVQPFAYVPTLAAPGLWPVLAGALVVLVADVTRRLFAGGRPGLVRYALLLALVAAAFTARRLVQAPRRPLVRDGLSGAIARVERAADLHFGRHGRYPTDSALLAAELPAALRDLGFFRRGARPLTTRVRVLEGAVEPMLAPDAETLPGDVVFALDQTGRRYWLTAFTLDPRGRLRVLTDEAGRALLAAGADGLPRSRLDPLFPDYPRKVPMAPKPAGP
jgi:hypothetical protein